MPNQYERRNERLENLRGKNPFIAYLLNVILPGLGNCLYGRPLMGVLLMIIVFLAALLFFAGGLAALIGIIIIIVSIIGAFFTFGLSLILLPLGVLMLFLGAGPLLSFLMYAFCLVVAEILVARTADKIRTLEENDQFRTTQSYAFQDTNEFEQYLTAQSAKASRGWLTAKILLAVLLFVGAAIIGGVIVFYRPPAVQPLLDLIDSVGPKSLRQHADFPKDEATYFLEDRSYNASRNVLAISRRDLENQNSKWALHFLFVSKLTTIRPDPEKSPWYKLEITETGRAFSDLLSSHEPQFRTTNFRYSGVECWTENSIK